MLSEEACNRLRELSNEELRILKLHTSEAKVGSHDYNLFKFVDRLLLTREGVRTPKTRAQRQFEDY
jgi:hypothetical protein